MASHSSRVPHPHRLWRSVPSASLLWLVLKADITGFSDDIYLGAVYVPPAQSALLHAVPAPDRFAALAESASAASALGRVLLMGDFNARVAIRPDVDDELAASLQAVGLPVARGCTDSWFGGHGRHLLQPLPFSWPRPCHWPSAWRRPRSPLLPTCSWGFSS